MTTVWTVLAAVLIFCIMIFVHELGHFLSAKLLGIRVHEFAIGMGPKLFGKTKGETLYSVRALPIGGYCALEGEDSESNDEKQKTYEKINEIVASLYGLTDKEFELVKNKAISKVLF